MPERFNPGEWLNEEEALVAAEAEKPVRDLAREEGVDAATKEVFDRRAEQRGDEALQAHRGKKEKLKGLVNPELKELRDKLANLEKLLKEEFGEDVLGRGHVFYPELSGRYQFNDNGELKHIRLNYLISIGREKITGVGPLGKKFEKAANAFGEPGTRGDGKGGMSKLEQAIVDAYNDDPEVKKLIDRLIELDRAKMSHQKRIEEIMRVKKLAYENGPDQINSFLGQLGLSRKVPDEFNAEEFRRKLYNFRSSQGKSEQPGIEKIGQIIRRALSAFDGIVISKEKEEDVKPDLEILSEIFRGVYGSFEISAADDVKKDFNDFLRTTEVGKRLVAGKTPLLYKVEG